MRTKGYKCYNVKCKSCICKTLCGEPANTALGCASRVIDVQTNADRLRASDKALAEKLADCTYSAKTKTEMTTDGALCWIILALVGKISPTRAMGRAKRAAFVNARKCSTDLRKFRG